MSQCSHLERAKPTRSFCLSLSLSLSLSTTVMANNMMASHFDIEHKWQHRHSKQSGNLCERLFIFDALAYKSHWLARLDRPESQLTEWGCIEEYRENGAAAAAAMKRLHVRTIQAALCRETPSNKSTQQVAKA